MNGGAIYQDRKKWQRIRFWWGQVEIKRSILDKSTWRHLLDIQQEMWSRRLELRGEVVAEIRSGRHQCVGNRSWPFI